jgi:hypothetical protein
MRVICSHNLTAAVLEDCWYQAKNPQNCSSFIEEVLKSENDVKKIKSKCNYTSGRKIFLKFIFANVILIKFNNVKKNFL